MRTSANDGGGAAPTITTRSDLLSCIALALPTLPCSTVDILALAPASKAIAARASPCTECHLFPPTQAACAGRLGSEPDRRVPMTGIASALGASMTPPWQCGSDSAGGAYSYAGPTQAVPSLRSIKVFQRLRISLSRERKVMRTPGKPSVARVSTMAEASSAAISILVIDCL